MRIVRAFFVFLLLLLVVAAVSYYVAGRAAGPAIVINQPSVVGQTTPLDITVDAPGAWLDSLSVNVEQGGRTFPVLVVDATGTAAMAHEGTDRLRIRQPVGRRSLPELRGGSAQISVAATRPVLWGLRHVSSRATRDIQVRLDPPRIGVISTHHYINLGGSEMVVYRVTPPDVESGVRVGDIAYPGFAATAAGVTGDATLKVAFFALLYDQDPASPIDLYARDAVGNEARAQFESRVFPKKFRRSTIPIDDAFLRKVVPPILQQSPQLNVPADDLLAAFLKVNNDLRRENNAKIAMLAAKTAPAILWHGAFQPLGGAQVESAFADYRSYLYGGKEIDRQVHLGFDLAKTVNAPVAAANDGTVIHASDLGIYGNCVILDHGMGVQSLYGHLSSFQVQEGEQVHKGQVIGLSGQTGMAGGDHLHFSMLVNGRFVNATEWWDPHWIEDRVVRKLREAGAPAAP
jgi:murein DD-endopeptidase MepM/ murein hydrolase activator NlpD